MDFSNLMGAGSIARQVYGQHISDGSRDDRPEHNSVFSAGRECGNEALVCSAALGLVRLGSAARPELGPWMMVPWGIRLSHAGPIAIT